MMLYELATLINQICPIYGVNSDGICHFKEEATTAQKLAAQAVIDENLGSVEDRF